MTISPQPEILRRLHRLLVEFGYEVVSSRQLSWRLGGVQHVAPDFVIIDADALGDDLQAIANLRENYSDDRPYVLVIADEDCQLDVIDAIEAGVNDFLAKPINNAEVLTRLRAGTKHLEAQFEGGGLLQTDQLTGLLTEPALDSTLRRQYEKTTAPGCIVLAEIDYLDEFHAVLGRLQSRQIVKVVGELVQELCGEGQVAARLNSGRFSVLLPGMSPDHGRRWAERLRERISTCDALPDVPDVRLSASLGVCGWRPSLDAVEDVLTRANRALQLAIQSGRDCSIIAGEVEGDCNGGTTDFQANPFSNAMAADVMSPSVLVFDLTEKVGVAAAKLNRSNLEVVPVVDEHRRLQGIARREDLMSSSDACPIRNVTKETVVRVREDTTLTDVMRELSDNQFDVAVVLRGEEPLGVITRSDLADLMRPVSRGDVPSQRSYFEIDESANLHELPTRT